MSVSVLFDIMVELTSPLRYSMVAFENGEPTDKCVGHWLG